MAEKWTPSGLVTRMQTLFQATGIMPSRIIDTVGLISNPPNATGIKKISTTIQRLYRYHDFCATGIAEINDVSQGLTQLWVEGKRHEALAISYRLMGMAIDATDPSTDFSLPKDVLIDEEIAAITGILILLYWAFASISERKSFASKYFHDEEMTDELLQSGPQAFLDPMGDLGMTIEGFGEGIALDGSQFNHDIYPPLHPAVEMDRMISKEEASLLWD